MTESNSERALLAILALEAEAAYLAENEAQALAEGPSLDERVEKYMRAMRDDDAGVADPTEARDRILANMAKDLAPDPEQRAKGWAAAPFAALGQRLQRRRSAAQTGLGSAAAAPSRRSIPQIGPFAAAAAAILVVGWSGAWLFALYTLNTTVAQWRDWEAKSGRQYACAAESFGGSPFRVEMSCAGLKAAVATENGNFVAEAKQMKVTARLFHPGEIVTKVEGPASFAQLGSPNRFAGTWSHAEATVIGPRPTPDGLSIDLADFRLDRLARDDFEPLARAQHVAFRAVLDPVASAATKKPAYNLASDIVSASLPEVPPVASRPFEARLNGVLHGVGDSTPKPLPERIRGWQRNGGVVEMTSIEIRGRDVNANAQGTIALSQRGGLDGLLELSGERYDRLFEALTGQNPTIRGTNEPAASNADGRSQIAKRPSGERDGGSGSPSPENSADPTQSPPRANVLNKSRRLPALRFVDGAAYFGSISLGRLPALF